MKLFPSLQKRYTKERFTAVQAQRLAQEIAFGPIVFQVSRLMLKFGIFGTSFTGSITHNRNPVGKRRPIPAGKGGMVSAER